MQNEFAVFIVTHGRPYTQKTLESLRAQGYTGDIWLVVDNEDNTRYKLYESYIHAYSHNYMWTFNKQYWVHRTECIVNTKSKATPVFARNASVELAKNMKYKYFAIMDDDVYNFSLKYEDEGHLRTHKIQNLDKLFSACCAFIDCGADLITFSERSTYFGGLKSQNMQKKILRTQMTHVFIMPTSTDITFTGSIFEDLLIELYQNAIGRYVIRLGEICYDTPPMMSEKGGLEDVYKELDLNNFIPWLTYFPSAGCRIDDNSKWHLMRIDNCPRLLHEIL